MRERESITRLTTELHFAQAGVPIPASLELGNIEATKEGYRGYASRGDDLAHFISECESSRQCPERVRVVEYERMEQALHSL